MQQIISNTTLGPLKSYSRSIKLNLMLSSSLRKSKRKRITNRKSIKMLILHKLNTLVKKAKINLKKRMLRVTQKVKVIKSLQMIRNQQKLDTMLRKMCPLRLELT